VTATSTVTVRCAECAAPLSPPSTARFITCQHCGTSLEIKREGGAVFADVVARLDRVEDKVDSLHAHHELARLDREWEAERETLLVRNKDGRTSVPTRGTALGAGAVAVIGGVLFASFAGSQAGIFAVAGPLFAVIGVVMAISLSNKAARYAERERAYQERRAELEQQLRP
jgi:DNA-directed RNA polymerase subunit RPC12/RpoP